tara:strand:- start:2025 stop:2762 length:738 start_codon:yes stop_codon:yes gene_type:complete
VKKKKIYFASDFHLGYHIADSISREKKIVSWLDSIKKDAKSVYLIGDIFDFWFEYKNVVPKGFVRFLGKIAELTDSGIGVHIVVGNHDLWMKDYLIKECGVKIHHEPITIKEDNKTIFIGHGDGLGPGEKSFKIIKKIFKNRICQWLFARIHPNTALTIAHFWSKNSREKGETPNYLGKEKEFLEQFCINHQENNSEINFYVLGHRHLPMEIDINKSCRYINTGDWLDHYSFAVFEKENISLKYY